MHCPGKAKFAALHNVLQATLQPEAESAATGSLQWKAFMTANIAERSGSLPRRRAAKQRSLGSFSKFRRALAVGAAVLGLPHWSIIAREKGRTGESARG
jgi:DMSO/TMAO reductase YedYZ heme-binding membrane subunit